MQSPCDQKLVAATTDIFTDYKEVAILFLKRAAEP